MDLHMILSASLGCNSCTFKELVNVFISQENLIQLFISD